MSTTITPFLMFVGEAEAAMNAYVALLPDATIESLERKPDGKVLRAVFRLAGQRVMCIDSEPVHAFGLTPSFSFFVDCESDAQLERLWSALIVEGSPLMPLSDYGFSRRFGWLNDRFGVSWQLNLA